MQPRLYAVLAMFALLAACNPKEQSNGQTYNEPAPPCSKDSLATFDEYKDNSSKVFNAVISADEARDLAKEYKDYITPIDPNATKAVWINRATILAFAEAFKKDCMLDGIRIYFGKYGEDNEHPDRSHQLTTFLIATRDSAQIYHRDIFLFKKEEDKKVETESSYNANHGELCPKSCIGSFYYDEKY